MTTEAAVRELREELGEIAAVEGCAGCECLLGVAAQALADLRRLPGDEARDAEADVRRLLATRAALDAAGAGLSGAAAPGATGDGRADAAARGCPGCGCDGCA
jgi:hypothetical protein